jgi:hypothetical protein
MAPSISDVRLYISFQKVKIIDGIPASDGVKQRGIFCRFKFVKEQRK